MTKSKPEPLNERLSERLDEQLDERLNFITSGMLPRLTELTRDLPDLFAAAGVFAGEEPGVGLQGNHEITNANPAEWMDQMIAVTRAYEAARRLVQSQDELLGQTMASLGHL